MPTDLIALVALLLRYKQVYLGYLSTESTHNHKDSFCDTCNQCLISVISQHEAAFALIHSFLVEPVSLLMFWSHSRPPNHWHCFRQDAWWYGEPNCCWSVNNLIASSTWKVDLNIHGATTAIPQWCLPQCCQHALIFSRLVNIMDSL